jgi:hypothetical protein
MPIAQSLMLLQKPEAEATDDRKELRGLARS